MSRVAVLDDWQNVAGSLVDWTPLAARADITFFNAPFRDEDDAAAQLHPFDILLVIRERTPFRLSLIERLPRLKMFGLTGHRAARIDIAAMNDRGITVCYTDGAGGAQTAELALGLMLAAMRRIPQGDASIRRGGFQQGVAPGFGLSGKVLGLIGLGRIGSLVAGYGNALGMKVVAWTANMTVERARQAGAHCVPKAELLSISDVISLHVVLSETTRNVLGAAEIAAMKQGALLVNTSRAGLIEQAALLQAVNSGRILAALDVYETEPLAPDDPIRTSRNTVLTPHLGYASLDTYREYFRQGIENALAFLDGRPIRVITSPPGGGAAPNH